MTNGEAFKEEFSPFKICLHQYQVNVYKTEDEFMRGVKWFVFSKFWWDAPCRE